MRALDEMLARWRKNPDAQLTLAICANLGASRREDLVREVGTAAEAWHRNDLGVMIAVGRMYLESGLYAEAQSALVTAGKVDPNQPEPYRFLGEVLLRRGDAARSEKVLARAIQLGRDDDDTKLWHERASVYLGLQKRVGPEAVAEELNRTVPLVNSIPPPTMLTNGASLDEEQVSTVRGAHAAIEDELPTQRKSSLPPPPVPPRALGKPRTLPGHPAPHHESAPRNIAPEPSLHQQAPDALPSWDLDSASVQQAQFGAPRIPAPPAIPQFSAPPPQRSLEPMPYSQAPFMRGGGAAALPDSLGSELDPFDSASRIRVTSLTAELPNPRAVLQELARAGIYDPQSNSNAPWEAPKIGRPRGLWFLLGSVVLVLALGVGAHRYQSMVHERELGEARALEAEVTTLLRQGTPQSLEASEPKFKRIFELDSTSQSAARLWLHNRALAALVMDEEPRGITGAMQRLQTLGAPAKDVAVGKIGSALIEGDLAGAATTMTALDSVGMDDPIYALLSGVVLDRAGEAGALQRYKKAIELDPDLQLGHVLAAQLALLQGGAEAKAVFDAALAKLGEAPASKALRALAWAMGPRDAALPSNASLSEDEQKSLPRLLRAVPLATAALQKMGRGDSETGLQELARAISAAGSPQVSSWLGFVALEAGDTELARSAALRAVRFSAIYVGARVLAARVAVASARLEEAKKAIEGLDPNDPEVAIVHAAAAYEGLDLPTLEDMTPKLDALARPNLAALAQGADIALGRKYPALEATRALSVPAVIYGDVVALDALLDKGQLNEAEQVLSALGKRGATPAVGVRRARLLRYQGKNQEAVDSADAALRDGAPTQRVLVEAICALLEAENSNSARDLVTRYPAALGSAGDWLKALVDLAAKNPRRAKATVAGLQIPSADSPLLHRVLAARTLAAVGDKRAKAEVAPLLRAFARNPDVIEAARAVGLAQ